LGFATGGLLYLVTRADPVLTGGRMRTGRRRWTITDAGGQPLQIRKGRLL
jgi:hypothetical protein